MTQGEKYNPRYHLNSLSGTFGSCNGLTRISLLMLQEIRSGATILLFLRVLSPTGHSLKQIRKRNLPIKAFTTIN